jgi:hypothetical protein
MEIQVDRSVDVSSFPNINGNIPFYEIKKDEQMEKGTFCEPKPEAYVIDTDAEWNSIAEKIHSESPLPNEDFRINTVLAYFWGRKNHSGNSFLISKVEADPNSSSVLISLKFTDGLLDALSCPYYMASISKTSHTTFVFMDNNQK